MKKKIWQLDYACNVGDRVFWENMKGDRFEGVITEWDSNVAIIKLDDGSEKAVEC